MTILLTILLCGAAFSAYSWWCLTNAGSEAYAELAQFVISSAISLIFLFTYVGFGLYLGRWT